MALWRDGAATGRPGADTRSHAERLPLEAMAFLSEHGCALAAIHRFVVVAGPGSFTGLRVGVAAVQGWAMATGRMVAAVPTLDALVHSLGETASEELIVSCLDGLRGEVFYGAWRGGHCVLPVTVGAPERAVADVSGVADVARVVIAGDGADRYASVWASAGWTPRAPRMTLAEAAARMAAADDANAMLPHAVRPNYVRRSDAEVVRDRKSGIIRP